MDKLIKIKHFNSEYPNGVTLLLEVECSNKEFKEVEQLIRSFRTANKFMSCEFFYINMLKKHGYKAKEVKFDLEVN